MMGEIILIDFVVFLRESTVNIYKLRVIMFMLVIWANKYWCPKKWKKKD